MRRALARASKESQGISFLSFQSEMVYQMSLKFDCSRVRKTDLIVIFCTLLLVCFKFCLSYEER